MRKIVPNKRRASMLPISMLILSLLPALIFIAISNAGLVTTCDQTYPPSPEGVVAAYLKEDFTRGSDYWDKISKYTTWSDGPGWDTTVLVSGYVIKNATVTNGRARVEVEYQNTGDYFFDEIGPNIVNLRKSEIVIFDLLKTGDCWKIENPQNPPHLNYKYIADDLKQMIVSENRIKTKSRLKEILNTINKHFAKQ